MEANDWKGSDSSEPLMMMLGKSSRGTSSGASMPLRVTMICLGCSLGGSDRISPAHTDTWMILR